MDAPREVIGHQFACHFYLLHFWRSDHRRSWARCSSSARKSAIIPGGREV